MREACCVSNICNYYSLYLGMPVCGCVHMNTGASRGQKVELDLLELESQAWVLGTELNSSGKAASILFCLFVWFSR